MMLSCQTSKKIDSFLSFFLATSILVEIIGLFLMGLLWCYGWGDMSAPFNFSDFLKLLFQPE